MKVHCLIEISNNKWFDRPFDKLTILSNDEKLKVLSKVEGLTTLSEVGGQITMSEIQNPKRKSIGLNRFETGDPPHGGESKRSADKFVIYLLFGAWNLCF